MAAERPATAAERLAAAAERLPQPRSGPRTAAERPTAETEPLEPSQSYLSVLIGRQLFTTLRGCIGHTV